MTSAPSVKVTEDRAVFEQSMKALESQIANVGLHVTIDATTRLAYAREIKAMAKKLENDALAGKISWTEAAKQAQETRNLIMEIFRRRSTPVGRAMAEMLKIKGYSLNELVARHTMLNFGERSIFKNLPSSKKDIVYASIVRSAGQSNTKVSAVLSRLSHAGRGLIVISVAISAYNIATSTDKLSAAGKELVSASAGVGGGIAGGALAGLACGPGAPICVTVGAFVGGTLAAFGISFVW
ncbi:hypothetical protein [Duganella violaceipulchra]|uniref:Uncharacterized protein n=1 Tax=Duganella violaceipulchra TaxID=2849652 RepID=A0AA41HEP3_9BURK|nr:hypothetical protein [Duganella violaceicalia]MBV6324695.1 hypothetical protein [Duganella violaceicalia]MCP2009859.1 hypothetical protein [Duganella violaceicalia]